MYEALRLFNENIEEAKNLTALYEYLENSINSPLSFDDLLRAQTNFLSRCGQEIVGLVA
ncbi:MAG: hypothetical protein QNJ33_17145 [Crocosphaera sp.]|nr:hypothetical protein [Crocosphaera sp.]